MIIAGAIAILGIFFLAAYQYWDQLHGDGGENIRFHRPFLVWAGKGLALPAIFWVLINGDFLPGLAPFLPIVSKAKYAGGDWLPVLWKYTAPGLLGIGSFWVTATFGAMAWHIASEPEQRKEVWAHAACWSILFSPFILAALYLGGFSGVGFAVFFVLLPVVHFTSPLAVRSRVPPSYARAIAKMKFGKYKEAEQSVIEELENSEDDFDGWLMLADLYANHFHERDEADAAIRQLCHQPNITGAQISYAFNRLADWHLNSGDDPASARRALEEICCRTPGSTFARLARQRIDQLPADKEELREQRKPKTIRLPALAGSLMKQDAVPAGPSEMAKSEAMAAVQQQLQKLNKDPNNVPARERFAQLLAEQLGKPKTAIEQIELLVAMPGQSPAKIAEWLGQIASWHYRYRKDVPAARQMLRRLIREHPESPQAFAAQRQLNLWEMEERLQKVQAAPVPRPSIYAPGEAPGR